MIFFCSLEEVIEEKFVLAESLEGLDEIGLECIGSVKEANAFEEVAEFGVT